MEIPFFSKLAHQLEVRPGLILKQMAIAVSICRNLQELLHQGFSKSRSVANGGLRWMLKIIHGWLTYGAFIIALQKKTVVLQVSNGFRFSKSTSLTGLTLSFRDGKSQQLYKDTDWTTISYIKQKVIKNSSNTKQQERNSCLVFLRDVFNNADKNAVCTFWLFWL